MPKIISFSFWILCCGLTIGAFSCTPPPPPKLSKAMISKVDSLYTFSLDSIKSKVELECQKRHASIYQNAVDSFQILRQEEFESILSQ